MEKPKGTWLSRPTKKQLVLLTVLWNMVAGCMLLAMTIIFSQPLFTRRNLGFLLLFGISALMVLGVYLNYLKRKKEG